MIITKEYIQKSQRNTYMFVCVIHTNKDSIVNSMVIKCGKRKMNYIEQLKRYIQVSLGEIQNLE